MPFYSLRQLGYFPVSAEPAQKWLAEERLRIIGRQLLNSTKSVQEIAAMFGYHSLSSFSRAFKAYFGCRPKQWQSAGNRIAHHGPPEMKILN
jgi:AraC-like DNA-binding protein